MEIRVLLSGVDVSHFAMPSYVPYNSTVSPALTSSDDRNYNPTQIKHAYGFDQIAINGAVGDGSGTTIAIVDAYDDPNIASDLHAFDQTFSLPDPILTKVNQNGGTAYPAPNRGWAGEIALDVEWAHAIAPGANILLVEANTSLRTDLFAAVDYARHATGVVTVSMSWGGVEFQSESNYDSLFTTPSGHAGVTFVAASGDSGSPPIYPSVSPNVLSVGGTSLQLDTANNRQSETAWDFSGGGISYYELQPSYQKGIVTQSSTRRTSPDVSYNGDPDTGFWVYNSYGNSSGFPLEIYGGTSAGAPQWAAMIAIADQGRALNGKSSLDGATQTLPELYSMPATNFFDITSGSSYGYPIESAGPGYDLVTGRGSPIANSVVSYLDKTAVTSSTANLPANASTITISGFGFDSIPANNTVLFNDNAVGSVTAASPTSLTVTFSIAPATAGILTAVVTADNLSSGAAVQVATVVPVLTSSTTSVAANATTISINGFGFDPIPSNNTAVFNDGAVGTVTAASPTSLTVTFSTMPISAGILTATITTDNLSSGTPLPVATVAPVITPSTTNLAANATTLIINGFGFDPIPGNNTVIFNDGAVGSVTSANPTSLTVTLSTKPITARLLTAVVTSNGVSSGTSVQVSTVVPIVIQSNTNLAANATKLTINGFGFDPTFSNNNSVLFNDGAVGLVTSASPTSLTVTFSTSPTSAGVLTAIVTTDNVSSGVPVQVGKILPVVPSSNSNLAINATTVNINGFGFDPIPSNNKVIFNDGAVGSVTASTPTLLTVTFTTKPKTEGMLTAVVTTDNISSGPPMQVAMVVPVVTSSPANLAVNATSLIINGFGFDPIASNNVVLFNDGAVGRVTAASSTSMTVTFTTKPTTAGILTAVVTTDKVSSGTPVPVATVVPILSPSSTKLAANVSTVMITGLGFDPTFAKNTLVFNDGAVGSVIAATSTSLTVTLSTKPATAGILTAVVITDNVSSGTPVQVATVAPVVTQNTTSVAANATTLTINGFGFDPIAARNTVLFNDGAAGSVIAASATALTVTFSTKPKTAGILTAVVTTDSVSSGAPAQVATLTPVLMSSTVNLAANASTLTINGFGFDPIAARNTVIFNNGAVGSVTAASVTSLTVTFLTKPKTAGILTAVVTTDSVSSGPAVQVATVVPVMTKRTTNLAANVTTLTINGFGFDSSASKNTVLFNDGAVGIITTASPTSLTVTFATKPQTAGILTAVVTTDSVSSGPAVQVATVVPVVIQQSTNSLPADATTLVINGYGFDPIAARNTVTFNDGAVGTVTTASANALIVTFTSKPKSLGILTAVIITDGLSSGSAVQVATVTSAK